MTSSISTDEHAVTHQSAPVHLDAPEILASRSTASEVPVRLNEARAANGAPATVSISSSAAHSPIVSGDRFDRTREQVSGALRSLAHKTAFNSNVWNVCSVISHILLGLPYLLFLYTALFSWDSKIDYVAHKLSNFGASCAFAPYVLVILVLLTVFGLSLGLAVGPEVGSMLLLVSTLIQTVLFHDFWHYKPGSATHQGEVWLFTFSLAMLGALMAHCPNYTGKVAAPVASTGTMKKND